MKNIFRISILISSALLSLTAWADVNVVGNDAKAVQAVFANQDFQGSLQNLLLENCGPRVTQISVRKDTTTQKPASFVEVDVTCVGGEVQKACGLYLQESDSVIGCYNGGFTVSN